jgi:F-type H+-transporting ATPase subunit b
MAILSTLGINGSLLIAQIINFVIIAGVLTYFIYRPILNLIDARRASIQKSMEDVEKIAREKAEVDEWRKKEMQNIDRQMAKLLDEAKADVAATKEQMVTSAKKEADEVLVRGKQQLESERLRITADLEKTVASLVVKLTGKLLEQELKPADQDRLVASLEHSLSTHHGKK